MLRLLAGEVYYRTFHNRRGVGQNIGLAPSPFQSGDMARDQGIAKAGNPRARKAMIELSWLWLHHQPDSALSKRFRERVGEPAVVSARCRQWPSRPASKHT